MQRLDAKLLDKLRKVWAMRDSNHAGEVRAAEDRAQHIVKSFGYELADVPSLLGLATPADAPRAASAAAYEDQQHKKRQAEADAQERAKVVQRYGSVQKVQAFQPNELLLRAAVRRWSTFYNDDPQRRTKSIAGKFADDYEGDRSMSKCVLDALSRAYPLPTTITEAVAEQEAWTKRHRDLELVADSEEKEGLDLACTVRSVIIDDLLEHGLRATSVAEILIRFRIPEDQGVIIDRKIEAALLKDLEHLATLEAARSVHFGRPAGVRNTTPLRTASERRAQVKRLLSNMDKTHLSDREIARQVGVSPQTVGNIRRKM